MQIVSATGKMVDCFMPCMRAGQRQKGQKSRSQGHATYQQQERNNLEVDGHINFELGAVGKINRK